jgi:3-hydroxybutyryl-CoA dehydratase
MIEDSVVLLGRGFYWQELSPGQRFATFGRTLHEADLINFVSVTGMLEGLFIDASAAADGIGGRPVPAALTYTLVEGFILQSMIRGTGIALLGCTQEVVAPVRVGDTIHGLIEVTSVKPTSRANRAVVDSAITVFNQRNEEVLRYTACRMIAGRPVPAVEP